MLSSVLPAAPTQQWPLPPQASVPNTPNSPLGRLELLQHLILGPLAGGGHTPEKTIHLPDLGPGREQRQLQHRGGGA